MKLKNAVDGIGPKIPTYFKDTIQIVSDCILDNKIILYFHIGMLLVAQELESENISPKDLSNIIMVFTKDGNFSFIQDDSDVYGVHCSFAIYNVDKILSAKNVNLMTFVCVEELAHHFWRIHDETKVKLKTIKILQRGDPSFTIDRIKGWDLNWK